MSSKILAITLRGAKCRNGMAATEFALLLPVMTTLMFGILELSDAMTINRRVAIAANTIADLTAQSEAVTYQDVNDLIEGVESIIDLPNDISGLEVNLVSVLLDGDGDPVVHWSRDRTGAEPYSEGAEYTGLDDDTVISDSGSLIIVEMSQPYAPRFTRRFVGDSFTFSHKTVRWPRLSPHVQLCEDVDTNCTSTPTF